MENKSIGYKGYIINSASVLSTETGGWTTDLMTTKHRDSWNETLEKRFGSFCHSAFQEDAIQHSLNFGKLIIADELQGFNIKEVPYAKTERKAN